MPNAKITEMKIIIHVVWSSSSWRASSHWRSPDRRPASPDRWSAPSHWRSLANRRSSDRRSTLGSRVTSRRTSSSSSYRRRRWSPSIGRRTSISWSSRRTSTLKIKMKRISLNKKKNNFQKLTLLGGDRLSNRALISCSRAAAASFRLWSLSSRSFSFSDASSSVNGSQ